MGLLNTARKLPLWRPRTLRDHGLAGLIPMRERLGGGFRNTASECTMRRDFERGYREWIGFGTTGREEYCTGVRY